MSTNLFAITITQPGAPSRRVPLDSLPLTVGRTTENTLVVSDPQVSSRHGQFVAVPGGVGYIDIGSRNGSRINGVRIDANVVHRLIPGDRVELGETHLVVEGPAAVQPVPVPVPAIPISAPPQPVPPAAPKKSSGGLCAIVAVLSVLLLCVCACIGGAGALYVIASVDTGPRTASSGGIGGNVPGGNTGPIQPGGGSPGERANGRDGSVLIKIPAGEFMMGAEDGEPDELPVRRVRTESYQIDLTLVTVEQFRKFASANQVRSQWSQNADPKSPVVNVLYADAEAYCKAQGRRLPTEVEWEKAARGTDGRRYPWGNDWDPRRAVFGNPTEQGGLTVYDKAWGPVGSRPDGASPFGVLDTAGGPREWTSSFYAPYEGAPTQPVQVPANRYRVTRGGYRYNNFYRDMRASARGFQLPDVASPDLGFRCAQ